MVLPKGRLPIIEFLPLGLTVLIFAVANFDVGDSALVDSIHRGEGEVRGEAFPYQKSGELSPLFCFKTHLRHGRLALIYRDFGELETQN